MSVSRWLLILFLAGIALRIAAIELRPVAALSPVERAFIEDANRGQLATGRDFLYATLSSPILRLLHGSPRGVQYGQALLSLVTGLILLRMARRRFTEGMAALVTGIWLLYPASILLPAILSSDTLLIFLWVLVLALYDRLEEEGFALKSAAPLGITLGLCLLARPTAIGLGLSLLVYVALIRYETAWFTRFKAAALMSVLAAMVAVPVLTESPTLRHQPVTQVSDQPTDIVDLWGKRVAKLWSTDAALWNDYLPLLNDSARISRPYAYTDIAMAALAVPYMLIIGFGLAGFYLVRQFKNRGLFILQILFGIILAAGGEAGARDHVPLIPAVLVGIGSLKRPRVWTDAPPWRRLFLLFTLGIFAGMWLRELMLHLGI